MLLEVVVASVSVSDALDPSVGGLDLSVPTVAGVMSHLVLSVLSESDVVWVNSDLDQELVGSVEEVSHGLIADQVLLDGFSESSVDSLSDVVQLVVSAPEWEFLVGNLSEFAVVGLLGVEEILDLSHIELSNSEEFSLWGDLVSESESDLGGSEWQSSSNLLLEFIEVNEHTLGRFWSQIPDGVSGRSQLQLEHQIEWFRLSQFVISLRGKDI